jgi:hypothetical protein
MDHHCEFDSSLVFYILLMVTFLSCFSGPWVNTCVGQNNLGHFYRFLVATSFGVIYCVVLIAMRLYGLYQLGQALERYYRTPWPHTDGQTDLAQYVTPQTTTGELVAMILNTILCFALLFTVFILCLFQTYYVGTNVTTIETYEKDRIDRLVDKGKLSAEKAKFPYDIGWFRNYKQVLGPKWWIWWWPQAPEGDGISFEVNEQAKKHGQLVEHEGRRYVVVMYPPPEYYDFYGKKRTHDGAPPPPPRFDPPAAVSPTTDAQGKQVVTGPPPPLPKPTPSHVRRGSEGYVVRTITEAEREKMVASLIAEEQAAKAPAPSPPTLDSKPSKARRKKLKAKAKKLRGALEGGDSSSYLADGEHRGPSSPEDEDDDSSDVSDLETDHALESAGVGDADMEDNADESEDAELWRIAKPQAASNKRK